MNTARALLVAASLASSLPLGCSPSSAAPSGGAGSSSTATTPRDAVAKAALVIDVRTSEEFAGGHLAQATNIPVDEVESRLEEISAKVGADKTKPIALYCASGRRADRAKATLEKAGFTQVTNAGGYEALK